MVQSVVRRDRMRWQATTVISPMNRRNSVATCRRRSLSGPDDAGGGEIEEVSRRPLRTWGGVWLEVFHFIEGWYNPRQRRSSLGFESQVRFEARVKETVA